MSEAIYTMAVYLKKQGSVEIRKHLADNGFIMIIRDPLTNENYDANHRELIPKWILNRDYIYVCLYRNNTPPMQKIINRVVQSDATISFDINGKIN